MNTYREIPVSLIDRDPGQPRKVFKTGPLEELAESIRRHGVLQPISVVELGARFRIVMGERRWRAAQLAQIETMPCIIRTPDEMLRVAQITENLLRADMEPLDEAAALQELLDQGHDADELGKSLGRKCTPGQWVLDKVGLLGLAAVVKDALSCGAINVEKAMRLSRLNIEHQQQVFKALKDGKIGPKREFEFMVDKLWAAEHQEVLFELPPEQSGQALKRIDEAIDRMLNFTRAMFRRDDARVLESLIGLDGLGPRIEKISAIMTELARVRTALQHAKAGNVAVQAGLLDSVGGAPARRR